MTKTTKLFILFISFALATASAATYSVTLFQPAIIAGKELKAGDYKVTIENDKAVISQGKEKVEATIKVETTTTKFPSTSVRYTDAGGKVKVQEIRFGGTSTKVVFN